MPTNHNTLMAKKNTTASADTPIEQTAQFEERVHVLLKEGFGLYEARIRARDEIRAEQREAAERAAE